MLREVNGNRLPLFKFIELFEKRYHRTISVSELYRLKDVIDIQGDEGSGRMIMLHSALQGPATPTGGSNSNVTGPTTATGSPVPSENVVRAVYIERFVVQLVF